MKRCPQCQQTFLDEYSYCLSDRTPLVPLADAPEEATVVTASPLGASPRPKGAGVNPLFAYLSIALLALVAGGAGVYWMTSGSGDSPSSSNDIAATKPPVSEPNPVQSPAPPGSQKTDSLNPTVLATNQPQKPTPVNKPADTPKAEVSEPTRPEQAAPQNYLTARIKFRRGRVEETVSGTISSERGYVLYTLAGQQLSARIRSGGNCVVFRNGSTTTSYTTSSGDSYLRLKNNCGDAAQFGLTVQVR